ncbi:MAG: hypothetical protein ACRDJN_11805 [Chloroflexota bacterium]
MQKLCCSAVGGIGSTRRLMMGTAGALAGAAVAAAAPAPVAQAGALGAVGGTPLPAPKPIPGGTQIPGGPLLHIFLPGPPNVTLPFSGLQLMGLNVEPSVITDFRGTTALAYLVGTATGNDGERYNLEVDLRVYDGEYVAENGSRNRGTFAMI